MVEGGIYQYLAAEGRAIPITRHERHGRREVASGTASAHRNEGREAADRRAACGGPVDCRVAVFEWYGEMVLGAQSVVDRHYKPSAGIGEGATRPFEEVQVSDCPSASVQINQDWKGSIPLRDVYPRAHITDRTRDPDVLDCSDRLHYSREIGPLFDEPTDVGHGHTSPGGGGRPSG
jgi:hypothetical protein